VSIHFCKRFLFIEVTSRSQVGCHALNAEGNTSKGGEPEDAACIHRGSQQASFSHVQVHLVMDWSTEFFEWPWPQRWGKGHHDTQEMQTLHASLHSLTIQAAIVTTGAHVEDSLHISQVLSTNLVLVVALLHGRAIYVFVPLGEDIIPKKVPATCTASRHEVRALAQVAPFR
jgi:hypothetical protein